MSTFVDCLMEALAQPACRARPPEEDLVVDTGRFRGLFMCGVRERAEVLREPVTGLAQWVKSGGLDEFLYDLADCLIEMGVVRDQGLLDRFLRGAVRDRLGAASELSQTDALLLALSSRAVRLGTEEAPVRLFARRYARALGLVRRCKAEPLQQAVGSELTPLGEAARRLPPELLLPFLVTLEGLCSYGSADPWRAPREAYELLHERGEALLFREEAERQRHDRLWLWRGHRLRRWVRMGLCEENQEIPQQCDYGVALSLSGQRALTEALRIPMAEVVGVCEELFARSRHEILAELWPVVRQGAARPGEGRLAAVSGEGPDGVPTFVEPEMLSGGMVSGGWISQGVSRGAASSGARQAAPAPGRGSAASGGREPEAAVAAPGAREPEAAAGRAPAAAADRGASTMRGATASVGRESVVARGSAATVMGDASGARGFASVIGEPAGDRGSAATVIGEPAGARGSAAVAGEAAATRGSAASGPVPQRGEPGGTRGAPGTQGTSSGSGAVRVSPPVQAIPVEPRAALIERPQESRPEAAPSKGEPELLDLEGLCQGALRDLQHNPRFSHLATSLTVAPGTRKGQLCLVQSRLAVRLLIGQMLGTAALAVAGLPAPRLELELSGSDRELTIWLHDNGPGIPISQRPLVFADPLRPGEVLPRYQLGAVKRVVQEHLRGSIEIAAPRLGGASFRLSIPRHSQRQAA